MFGGSRRVNEKGPSIEGIRVLGYDRVLFFAFQIARRASLCILYALGTGQTGQRTWKVFPRTCVAWADNKAKLMPPA